MLVLIFEKVMNEKIAPGILRFVSMVFFNIWRSDEQKNCARYFEICKAAIFNIWKSDGQKNCAR